MACMFPLDENVHLCGVDTKIETHSGRRSQLFLSAMRCGHPSLYIGSSVDRALSLTKLQLIGKKLSIQWHAVLVTFLARRSCKETFSVGRESCVNYINNCSYDE